MKIKNNVNNMSVKEILDLVEDKDPRVHVDKYKRAKIIQLIYQVLGYTLTPEILYMLLVENNEELVVATAGSGKTTNAQIKIIGSKIFRYNNQGKPLDGKKILCLVYNKQNVKQMEDKQVELVNKLYRGGVKGISIDREVNAKTFHSFCLEWSKQYFAKMGLLGYSFLSDAESTKIMNTIINLLAKNKGVDERLLNHAKIKTLYNLYRETLTPIEEIDTLKGFIETKCEKEFLTAVFMGYDNNKRLKKKFDYTDMLYRFLELLRKDEEVRVFIQDYYQYIVADEVQDFTPIMIEILYLITQGRTPILAIGDEDQCIYGFRGSNIRTLLDFQDKFPSTVITSLGTNRRCADNILKLSDYIISHNSERFDKEIRSIRPGGKVELIPYSSQDGQVINIVKTLKQMSDAELEDTVVCYRDRKSSTRLTSLLEKNNIAFNVLSGESPFSHELYKHVINVLDALYYTRDVFYHINLYKVLPLTKSDIEGIVGYDSVKKTFKNDDRKHWGEYSYGKAETNPKFTALLLRLYNISKAMNKLPLKDYFPEVFGYICKYFWNYKKEINKTLELDEYFQQQVIELFNTNLTYEEFLEEYNRRKETCHRNQLSRTGVTVSTFHSLKGLEFKNVFIIDLEDSIFPNYAFMEMQSNDIETLQSEKESEVRLFFVAVTRAIDNLYLYYQENNPSLYVKWIMDKQKETKNKVNELSVLDMFDASPIEVSSSSGVELEVEPYGPSYSSDLEIEDIEEMPTNIETPKSLESIEETVEEDSKELEVEVEEKEDSLINKLKQAEPQSDNFEVVKNEEVKTDNSDTLFRPDNFINSVLRGL